MRKQKHIANILISGGGTGGHLFPAIAIAEEIGGLRPDLHLQFVGALGKMEMDKVPKAGYPIIGLPVTAFHRRLTWKNVIFPFRLLISMIRANSIIKQFRPVLVIGTGGFASGPLLRAASRRGIPILIQEQNAFPGVTNRLMAKKAQRICVAHEGLERWFPKHSIAFTGNPVRKDLIDISGKRREALAFFGLTGQKPVVLLFGGSLGALALNQAVENNIEKLTKMNLSFIWQTGVHFFDRARELMHTSTDGSFQSFAFLERMDLAYAAADIVISRAGAITLSELALAGKPCILVPYPSAAGNHQMKNALSYKHQNAAEVIDNKDITTELIPTLTDLLSNESRRRELSDNLRKLARPDAGRRIAQEALNIIEEANK